MDIGKSVKIALIKAGQDRQWLASKMGVSRQRIHHIVNNKGASAKTLEQLSIALDLSIAELIALGED